MRSASALDSLKVVMFLLWGCPALSGVFFVCLREAVVQQAQNVNCGIFRAVVLVAMQFSRKLNMALSCDLSGIWTVC